LKSDTERSIQIEIPKQKIKISVKPFQLNPNQMKKFYAVLFISILFLFPFNSFAKRDRCDGNAATQNRNGFVVLKLDNSINDGKSINAAYIVLDKYDLTYAGFINQKFDVVDNKIMISDP
jgi:hypothetical protein